MAEDAIQDVRDAVEQLEQYGRTYHPGEPIWRDTFGRLASALGRLTDEVERLRESVEGDSSSFASGGIEGPFVDNDGNEL